MVIRKYSVIQFSVFSTEICICRDFLKTEPLKTENFL